MVNCASKSSLAKRHGLNWASNLSTSIMMDLLAKMNSNKFAVHFQENSLMLVSSVSIEIKMVNWITENFVT